METTLERLSVKAAQDPTSDAAFEIWFMQSGFQGGNKMTAGFAWVECRRRVEAAERARIRAELLAWYADGETEELFTEALDRILPEEAP